MYGGMWNRITLFSVLQVNSSKISAMEKRYIYVYKDQILYILNSLYTIVPNGIIPLNYDNRAFRHAVY